jgi:hypothetical protein
LATSLARTWKIAASAWMRVSTIGRLRDACPPAECANYLNGYGST